jgi:hypothetical protein
MRTAPPAAAPQADARGGGREQEQAEPPVKGHAWRRGRRAALAVIITAAALGGGLAAAGALSSRGPAPHSAPAPVSLADTGTVTGYIDACTGLALLQPYAAGTVMALPGQVTWAPAGAGFSRPRFPATFVAEQHVGQDQQFSFHLAPGHYVLVGHYDRGNTTTFLDVSIVAGQVLHRDLPDLCK